MQEQAMLRCADQYDEKQRGHLSLALGTVVRDLRDEVRRCSEVDTLIDRLDSTILVTGLLATPIYSITSLRSIAANPALRTIGLLACVIDVVGLFTSLALRLRLKLLNRDSNGRDEQFAQAVRVCWSERSIAAVSPVALITSSILLFLIVLSGTLFKANPAEVVSAPYHTVELVILGSAMAFAAVQVTSVARMCLTLG